MALSPTAGTEWSLALINLKFICLLSEDPVHHPHWSKKKNEVTSLIADYLTMRLIALGYMLPVTEHYLNYPDQTPLSAMIKNINQENNIWLQPVQGLWVSTSGGMYMYLCPKSLILFSVFVPSLRLPNK